MTRHHPRSIGVTLAMIGTTLSVLVFSASPSFASYRAWYSPWDYIGDFQPGDVSEEFTEMFPPAVACGMRIKNPSTYRWTNDEDDTVTDQDGNWYNGTMYKDVIIWLDNPGCSRSFSVTTWDEMTTYSLPPVGAVSIEIFTSYGAYWVNDNGYYLYTCGACKGPDDEAVLPPDDEWSLPAASGLKAVSAALIDPRRQTDAASVIASLSHEVAQLQPFLQKRIVDRRRVRLGSLEASVRSLEDAAVQALAEARTSAAACETLARQSAYTDSFVACTTAARQVERSQSLMRTAWFLYVRLSK